jgi:hypothetical protein
MGKIRICSEYSAQRIDALPNPMVQRCIHTLAHESTESMRVADQGCGKLRHLDLLAASYSDIVLVDTPEQLRSLHRFAGTTSTIDDYIQQYSRSKSTKIALLGSDRFSRSRLGLDIIFSIATYDVVPGRVRSAMAQAAYRNLQRGGSYVVVVPRNDSSILTRCSETNRYMDGHIFFHHGVYTYFRNYDDDAPIMRTLQATGFRRNRELSNYRQLCLILRK